MKSPITSGQKISPVDFSKIPTGMYPGFWGGYEVETIIDGETYQFRTENGIRTMNAPVIVTVKDGVVSVETI